MNLSVQGIAEQAGFTSRQTFTRLFHDFFGMTPTEYYERIKMDRDR
ncbi:AraC family transcriptional regulator [Chryseobacterium sp. A301]